MSNKNYFCKQPVSLSQLCFVEEIGQELKDIKIHEQE